MPRNDQGCLYIVATPIGNLGDITHRAVEVLGSVDVIAAEDTRHTRKLLQNLGIDTFLFALHEHNETEKSGSVIRQLKEGKSIALVSDAGTPLISDPGYVLVNQARAEGIRVIPVPGPSSILAALSSSGLPTDRFSFEGFLPAKKSARQSRLQSLEKESRTLVFFEAPHRLAQSLADCLFVFGEDRRVVVARELTKTWETFLDGPVVEVLQTVKDDTNQQRGEVVLMVRGATQSSELGEDALLLLKLLTDELPLKKAAAIVARFTGLNKKVLYEAGLARKNRDQSP